MSAEIRLAFEHPEERAAATALPDPLDRISLRDYSVEIEIGAFQQERGTTQTICFNIVVEVQPLEGPIDDDVDRILSYDRIPEAITAELSAERLNLLETLAERVADRILLEPQAKRVFVRIEKLDRGPGRACNSLTETAASGTEDEIAPHPRVVFLSNTAILDPNLGAMIDDLAKDSVPLIFCIGMPEASLPVSNAPMAQRRIDLLAIEQNAWVLAGRDRRCVVTGTRTELDWAMKNGQITVWAPSKMVLDAVDGPETSATDALGLAVWFAQQMHAQEMVTIGIVAPSDAPIPTREVAMTNTP